MKAHFKGPKKIDGKLYAKGPHDLADKLADHWYLKALIKQGDVALLEEPKAEPACGDVGSAEDEAPSSQPQGKKKAK